ncbi:hypothetical protein CAK95_08890 [Pseudorhodoplanes sinuspersici]|uniref:Uncharacterized protein n=1 Tax=Pseudorhodoplanes sinuspersici TaxID=1235591 RepID=A0A1W6ZP60_9HYPH|nr:hypothetical protein CAK95_08890 [Pseudorhodoplanes sinuspersici]
MVVLTAALCADHRVFENQLRTKIVVSNSFRVSSMRAFSAVCLMAAVVRLIVCAVFFRRDG